MTTLLSLSGVLYQSRRVLLHVLVWLAAKLNKATAICKRLQTLALSIVCAVNDRGPSLHRKSRHADSRAALPFVRTFV